LVTDLPADFETFGQAVATSMADLLGGTTGQVLSKASNTDMDFTWVAADDTNAIQNAIVDAKGDLIAASAADTPARLAVGNNGETLVADSSTATGLRYQGSQVAGKNAVIGGSFDIWQRGTTATTSSGAYTGADRWFSFTMTAANSSQVTLAAGSPCTYGVKFTSTSGTNSVLYGTALESQTLDPLRGQTVTLSFYAYCSTGTVSLISYAQKNATANTLQAGTWTTLASPTNTVTTTPTRFSVSFALAGDSSTAGLRILFGADNFTNGANFVIYGVQLEIGSVATTFMRSGGTIQGESLACQKYARNIASTTAQYGPMGLGFTTNTTNALIFIPLSPEMRTTPTLSSVTSAAANFQLEFAGAQNTCTAIALGGSATAANKGVYISATSTGLTGDKVCSLRNNNSATNILLLDAEL
jgi:hypothetical protein